VGLARGAFEQGDHLFQVDFGVSSGFHRLKLAQNICVCWVDCITVGKSVGEQAIPPLLHRRSAALDRTPFQDRKKFGEIRWRQLLLLNAGFLQEPLGPPEIRDGQLKPDESEKVCEQTAGLLRRPTQEPTDELPDSQVDVDQRVARNLDLDNLRWLARPLDKPSGKPVTS
jgi:hypothetical protein